MEMPKSNTAAGDRPHVPAITMFSRPGCHLCDEMKDVVERVSRRVALTLREVDISTDIELERLYGAEIPVLMIGGRKVAKYRIDEPELIRKLERYC